MIYPRVKSQISLSGVQETKLRYRQSCLTGHARFVRNSILVGNQRVQMRVSSTSTLVRELYTLRCDHDVEYCYSQSNQLFRYDTLKSEAAIGPRREKTCLRGFRQSEFLTSLLGYSEMLENGKFACSSFRYDTFQQANNKGADQTARMHRLDCSFVVPNPTPEDRFSRVEAQS